MKTNETTPIPQGYKATPLGMIPQEWEVKKLGDISQCFSGGTPKAGNNEYYCGNIPFIRSGEIHQKDTELFLSELGLAESSAKMVQKGDLLMALYGANSGDSAVSQMDGAINQAILCIRPHNVLVSFLCPFLELNKAMYIAKYLQGGQGNLSGEIVLNYKIPVPPLAEQKKIAEVLGVWDKAIEKQSQLIEQLTLRKRGLMQQLLTAKRRLPGFSDPWEKVKLGDIAQCFSGGTPKAGRNEYYDGNIPFIRSGEIHQKDTELFLSKLGMAESSAKMVQKGDLLMALYGANSGDVSISQIDGAINQAILCIRPRNVLVSFLCPFLNLNKDMYIAKYLQGGQGNLSGEIVLNYKIPVPPLAEQTAIAQVLTVADREIELAQQKLELLRQQKRGLMQQLLTGKKRVKL